MNKPWMCFIVVMAFLSGPISVIAADRCPACCTNNCKDCSGCKPNMNPDGTIQAVEACADKEMAQINDEAISDHKLSMPQKKEVTASTVNDAKIALGTLGNLR